MSRAHPSSDQQNELMWLWGRTVCVRWLHTALLPWMFTWVKRAQIASVCGENLWGREAESQAGLYLHIKKINTLPPPPPLTFFQKRQKKSLGGKAASYCIIKAFLCSNKIGCLGQLCVFKKKKKLREREKKKSQCYQFGGERNPSLLLCKTGKGGKKLL